MSYQEQSHLNPLSQIPLTKSPFVQFPQAITLPYNYVQLPSSNSLPQIPDVPDFRAGRSHAPSAARKAKFEDARRKIDEWETSMREKRMREARRIAPGFLDTGVTMLTPTVNTQEAVHPPKNDIGAAEETPVQKEENYSDQFASLRF